MDDFNGYLRRLRKEKGLTLMDLASKTGLSHSYISQVERGERGANGMPSVEVLRKLSKPLGVEAIELLVKAGYLEEAEHEGMMKSAEKFREYRQHYGLKDIAVLNDQEIILEDLISAAYLNTTFNYAGEPLELEKKVYIAHFLEVLLNNEMPIEKDYREKILGVLKLLLK